MPKVTFIKANGEKIAIEAPSGISLMETAVRNNIDGILAECGGACSCATCHVLVAEEWAPRLPPPDALETDMLEMTAAPRRPNSRLACQIVMSGEIDGIVVALPDRQS